MFDVALAFLPESLRVDGSSTETRRSWQVALASILQYQAYLAGGGWKGTFDRMDAALAKEPEAKVVRLTFRGIFLTDYAWQARGDGYANRVTEDGWRKFGERLTFSTANLPDPLFGTPKNLVMVYSVDGKVGLAIRNEGPEFTLPPKGPGRMSAVPSQGFDILDAGFGYADRWGDVTDEMRERMKDGKLPTTAGDLPDPAFGVHKSLVILYAWEGRVLLATTRDDLAISLPALPPFNPPPK